MYIVRSGDGFFVRFDYAVDREDDIPMMDSDPLCATRMNLLRAGKVIKRLGELGFVGALIELVFVRIQRHHRPFHLRRA